MLKQSEALNFITQQAICQELIGKCVLTLGSQVPKVRPVKLKKVENIFHITLNLLTLEERN